MNAQRTLERTLAASAILAFIAVHPLSGAQNGFATGVDLQVRDGRPIVSNVFINGHGPYRFLLDTGTNTNLIDSDLAQSIGMSVTFSVEMASTGGTMRVPGANGNVIALGSVQAERQTLLFSTLEAVHRLSSDIRGVLGQGFLSRFNYLLDLRAKRLVFGTRIATGTRVNFETRNGRSVVATNLGRLVIDSGTRWVILFGVETEASTHRVRTLTGSLVAGTVARDLTIGGHHVWYGEAIAIPRPSTEAEDGLLPVSAFHSIYVCNSENYVVLD